MASPKASRGNWLAATGQFLRTERGAIAACALVLTVLYYAAWGGLTLTKSSVSFGFIALGLKYIWDGRAKLQQERSYPEERFMGYALAGCGLALFFWFSGSASFQCLALVVALAGLALVLWGAGFFVQQGVACLFLAIGLYPDLIFLTNSLWRLATPSFLLENFTGHWAGRALALIGQPVVVEGRFISLGQGAVEVASGCSGFDMAVSMAAVGLLMGLFYRQAWPKILLAIALGILLALLVNIPRVMLLAYVVGHYSEAVFKFWHGPWGGQIFMALLFTPYYYLVMAIFDDGPKAKSAVNP